LLAFGEERRGEERRGEEGKGKERKGKERKGKERKGKERKRKERKGKDFMSCILATSTLTDTSTINPGYKFESYQQT
jgi:hypothetical protein